jgi:hypothetical protein
MKTRTPRTGERAITRTEVLVIAVIVVFFFAGFLPWFVTYRSKGWKHAARIKCVGNNKQLGLSYRVWANDNDDKYPYWSPTRDDGGARRIANPAFMNDSNAWTHFLIMSNEIGSAKVLMCPTDRERHNNMCVDFSSNSVPPNFGFDFQKNRGTSYFIGLDADETRPQVILGGDRNIVTNASNLRGSVVSVPSARPTGWTRDLHGFCGNAMTADGSVQQMNNAMLDASVSNAAAAGHSNRFLLPIP